MSWVRGPASTTCTVHATEWQNDAAETCPRCSEVDADRHDDDAPGPAEVTYRNAIADGLPTPLEMVRHFRSTGRLARRWAKEAKAAGEMGAAARLLDANIKAE